MQQLSKNIYKIKNEGNVYFLDFEKKIIIDTGKPQTREFVKKELTTKINPEKIELVIFTHLHYDHIGNFSLFPKATFSASAAEIAAWQKDHFGAILNMEMVDIFTITLQPIENFAKSNFLTDDAKFSKIILPNKINYAKLSIEDMDFIDFSKLGLEVITTPGHTVGSICIWYPKEKILFSGDTLFQNGYGRVDLPTSVPKEIQQSLLKLKKLNYKILCSGHDY